MTLATRAIRLGLDLDRRRRRRRLVTTIHIARIIANGIRLVHRARRFAHELVVKAQRVARARALVHDWVSSGTTSDAIVVVHVGARRRVAPREQRRARMRRDARAHAHPCAPPRRRTASSDRDWVFRPRLGVPRTLSHVQNDPCTRSTDPIRAFQSTARSHRRQIARKCRQMTARIQRHALALKNRTKDASSSRAPRPIPPARAPCNADSARTCVRACSHHHSSNTPDASSSALRETTRAHTHAVSHAPNIRRASRIVVVVVVDHRTHRPRWHPRTRPQTLTYLCCTGRDI